MEKTINLYEYFQSAREFKNGDLHCYIHNNQKNISGSRIYPAVLIIAGGAYNFLCYRENIPIAERLYVDGFNVFVLDYTCGKKSKFPDSLIEGAMAMIYIRENSVEYNLNINKISVIGFSAGGHLAGMISNFNYACLNIFKKEQIEKIKPDFTVYVYPVVSTRDECIHLNSFKNLLKEDFNIKKHEISLENMISSASPPAFIAHCSDDTIVNAENSLLLAEAYFKNSVSVEFHLFKKGNHGFAFPTLECFNSNELKYNNQDLIIWYKLLLIWLKSNGNIITD